MKTLKVGAGALNQTPLDWKGNYERITSIMLDASAQGVTVLCLPELCITGYGCEDAFLSVDVQERALEMLAKVTAETVMHPNMVVCVGLPVVVQNALYNCTAVLCNGFILGMVPKQHLAGDGIHYEPRWFKPWPAGEIFEILTEATGPVCFGDISFNFGLFRLGFEICEDAWVAERPGAHLARQGVNVILNPSASHFAFGKQEIRKRFVIEGSRAFAATYVYANLLGNEAGRAIYDGECLIATGGKLVAQGQRFSMKPWVLTTAVVDLDATKTQQVGTASYTPSFQSTGTISVLDHVEFTPQPAGLPSKGITGETSTKDGEFANAVTLGLFDYLRKSHSKGFVISLSGGADSAVCAYLVWLMIERGVRELDYEGFCQSIGVSFQKEGSYNYSLFLLNLYRSLLTCVYQKTENSSETTLNAARQVAEDVSAKFLVLDVDSVVKAYTSMVAVALQHEFSWETDDVTLQNIQARSRAPSVWMIANIEHKLLITTSNRSEAAVGYCTMDGDTAGSIAPIAGIDKAFLRSWLNNLAITRLSLKGLALVNAQAPTAELRPGASGQTDEKDLMPYDVLEFIEDCAILERKGPADVYTCLMGYLRQFNPEVTKEYCYSKVEKFFKLWCRNQWKRERYALSFHLDDKNLDPRSWCRFPVLSGGYEVELKELREKLKISA